MSDERTRKNEAQILQALARAGQKPVSELFGVPESTLSRMKEGEIARFAKLLAALELAACNASTCKNALKIALKERIMDKIFTKLVPSIILL